MRSLLLSSAGLALIITSSAYANQNDTATPPDPTTASASEPRNQSMTVAGCLRAGEAENTFVLSAAGAQGSTEPATYELVGTAAELRDHVGNHVEVSGIWTSEQELKSRTTAVEDNKAKGTTGTPVVETQMKVEIRRLEVSSVRPLGSACLP